MIKWKLKLKKEWKNQELHYRIIWKWLWEASVQERNLTQCPRESFLILANREITSYIGVEMSTISKFIYQSMKILMTSTSLLLLQDITNAIFVELIYRNLTECHI